MGNNQNTADAGFGEVTGIVHDCEAQWDARRPACMQGRSLASYRGTHHSLVSLCSCPDAMGLPVLGTSALLLRLVSIRVGRQDG